MADSPSQISDQLLDTEFGRAVFASICTGDNERYLRKRFGNIFSYYQHCADPVILMFFAISQGMRLRIPHDGGNPQIVEGLGRFQNWHRPSVAVDRQMAMAAIQSGLLRKSQREDELDEHGNGLGGWLSAGFDGDVADWYCMVM